MRYHRKVIRIRAEDSPNVALGLAERNAGLNPSHEEVVPGVLTLREYDARRATWSQQRQSVGLDGLFWEGAEELLFPEAWLDAAASKALSLRGAVRICKGIGIDPAEGGDKTAMCAVDEYGIIELVSKKTPDTSIIAGEALAFMKKHRLDTNPQRVCFDRGGGGKQHADALRAKGYDVRTVSFGTILNDPKKGNNLYQPYLVKREDVEDRSTYKTRAAEMYDELSMLLNPVNERGFAIPYGSASRGYGNEETYDELRRQLVVYPRWYDEFGRMYLPSKSRRKDEVAAKKQQTLTEMIGHSPDEADALVLACHAMFHLPKKPTAGAVKV